VKVVVEDQSHKPTPKMPTPIKTTNEPSRSLQSADDVMAFFRIFQNRLSTKKETDDSPSPEWEHPESLMEKQDKIGIYMLEVGQFISDGVSSAQKNIDPLFRDEFVHLLMFTHLRLIEIANETSGK
jgi:hypothetical protein